MIYILYGADGIGKRTVSNILVSQYRLIPIQKITTKLLENDENKWFKHISDDEVVKYKE